METRHLKYFVAVAEELHFGKAAKRLHISQPPLSQQIMKFEEQLGVTLFTRNKRSVALTSAGKCFLLDAQNILKEMELAKENLKAVATGLGGRFELGYIAPALDTPLTAIIKQFKIAYPGVRLGLTEMSTNRQLEVLRKGDIDAGVVRLFMHDMKGLCSKKFHQESYALILPTGHRLAGKESVDISELGGEEFIFFPRNAQPRLHDAWMTAFNHCNYSPNIVQEVSNKAASLALVAAGIGISIVPESLARRSPEQVVFKKLTGDVPTLEIHVVYRENTVHASRDNFLRIVRDNVSD
ncbi:MAG: DNA-binding transcriptional LysR family regulator [Desulforhopalus sp.]|jgi:DNA-binding transcriptional LysR family regulator